MGPTNTDSIAGHEEVLSISCLKLPSLASFPKMLSQQLIQWKVLAADRDQQLMTAGNGKMLGHIPG
jgi:hypothetical protein